MKDPIEEEEILAAQRILAKKIIEQGGCLGVLCDVNIITIDTGVEVECECPLSYDPWFCLNSVDNPEKVQIAKKWLTAHPEEAEASKSDSKRKIHQLTAKSAVRLKEELIQEQNGLCSATGKKLRKPVLDHEHRKGFLLARSGQIRGVLENDINQLLGKIEFGARRFGIPLSDLPGILRGLADYLEQPLLPYIHPSEKPKEPVVMARSYTQLGVRIVKEGGQEALPKWWGYSTNKKGNPNQKMTKQLQALYDRHGIEPEFYK